MAVIDNLMAYWSLEESSGTAVDAHDDNDLSETVGVGTGTGKVGNARDFERASEGMLSIADNADLSTGDIDFSMACWVNLESMPASGQFRLMDKYGDEGSEREFALLWYQSGNRFEIVVSDDGTGNTTFLDDTSGLTFSTSTWYFVACGHSASANEIWISINAQGTPGTTAHSTGVRNGTAAFALGARSDNGAHWFDGLIDEAGFWKRDIRSDLSWLYNSGSGRSYADIVAEAGGGGGGPRRRRMLICGSR